MKIILINFWFNQRLFIQFDCPSNVIVLVDFCSAFFSQVNVNLTLCILNLHLIGWTQLSLSWLLTSCCQPSKCKLNIVHLKFTLNRLTKHGQKSTHLVQYIFIYRLWRNQGPVQCKLCQYLLPKYFFNY